MIKNVLIGLLGIGLLWLLLKPGPAIVPIRTRVINETPTKVKEYTDANGDHHIVYLPAVVSQEDLRDPEVALGIIDTSAMLLNIAREQIISVKKLATVTKDSLLQAKMEVNRLQQKIAKYQDKFVQLAYNYNDSTFSYTGNSELTITDYRKRKWFLAPNKTYVDISSTDPRTKINGFRTLTVEPRVKSFGATLSASSMYEIGDGTLGVGGKATVNLGRLGINGSYLYNPNEKQWKSFVGVDFRLLGL